MPRLSKMDWDSNALQWVVVITDERHTWQGRSFLLSLALAAAFTRYIFGID